MFDLCPDFVDDVTIHQGDLHCFSKVDVIYCRILFTTQRKVTDECQYNRSKVAIRSELYGVCVLEEDPGPAHRVRVVQAGGVGAGRGGRAGGHGCTVYNRYSYSLHPCFCVSNLETRQKLMRYFFCFLHAFSSLNKNIECKNNVLFIYETYYNVRDLSQPEYFF